MPNDRDTHFQGFANLFWDELMMVSGGNYGWIDVSDDGLDADIIEKYKALIAQRAYDLLFHAFKDSPGEIEMAQWGGPTDEEVHTAVAGIPDLTRWPKTAE